MGRDNKKRVGSISVSTNKNLPKMPGGLAMLEIALQRRFSPCRPHRTGLSARLFTTQRPRTSSNSLRAASFRRKEITFVLWTPPFLNRSQSKMEPAMLNFQAFRAGRNRGQTSISLNYQSMPRCIPSQHLATTILGAENECPWDGFVPQCSCNEQRSPPPTPRISDRNGISAETTRTRRRERFADGAPR